MRNFVGPSDTPDASPSHVAASSDGRPGGPRIKQNTNELQLRIAKVTITNHYYPLLTILHLCWLKFNSTSRGSQPLGPVFDQFDPVISWFRNPKIYDICGWVHMYKNW